MYSIGLSLFFPCYNEELNLERLVLESIRLLNTLTKRHEILIVDDGSTDNTGPVADRLAEQYENVHAIHHRTNRGYGAALVSGFRNCLYEWIFYTDGDSQFFIEEIEVLLKEINSYDLIIGYRRERQDPWHRILYGWGWNCLVQFLFGLNVKDINCAFKLIKKDILNEVPLCSSGAVISTELLVRATLCGCRIKEIGVSHRPRVFGTQTGGSPKVVLRAFHELFRLHKEIKTQRLK